MFLLVYCIAHELLVSKYGLFMQVSVVNVHLRLEDDLSGAEKFLVAGVAMEKLVVSNSKTPSVRVSIAHCTVSAAKVWLLTVFLNLEITIF